MDTLEFEPSKLGIRAHWDHVYEREVANFEATGDEGEIWFGEGTVEKMVDWALENVPAATGPRILEIGSGNGVLLFALREAGYTATGLSGLDYSPDAVKLARMIAQERNSEEVTFHVCDFLKELPPSPGTYDAIALGEKDDFGISPVAAYPVRASRLLRESGYFLITSCNFTEEELRANFINQETNFQFQSLQLACQAPIHLLWGKTGSVYTTVAFKKGLS
ncbi:S-adenosyl-L-methionine-dependent methyltransferase [Multifurca ochricompacta]|uniref:Protein-lysine N-methyltransferase EFM4 n=1 Tax=Multifurca ochricompacta TaxID=376703 RepID=A0AAD4M825_9AGAM|nr:S-adenosyl-L-methionine-dependent methyltransferase [Multifurca ochricompacta]